MVSGMHDAKCLQLHAHGLIDLTARGIVGRNDDGVLGPSCIIFAIASMRCWGSAISVMRPCCCSIVMPCTISLLERCSTARSSSGSFWRTIWSSMAVCIPACCNCSKGFPASTPWCWRMSPMSSTRSCAPDLFEEISQLLGTGKTRLIDKVEMAAAGSAGRTLPARIVRETPAMYLLLWPRRGADARRERWRAKPSTSYPRCSAPSRMADSVLVFPEPASPCNPWIES